MINIKESPKSVLMWIQHRKDIKIKNPLYIVPNVIIFTWS